VHDLTFYNHYLAGKQITGTDDAGFQPEFAGTVKFVTFKTIAKKINNKNTIHPICHP